MTKAELIDRIASNVEGVTKAQVVAVYDQVFEGIVEALKSDAKHKFTVQGFGTFDVRSREARKGRNPATGESIDIAASTSVGFKASDALKAKFE